MYKDKCLSATEVHEFFDAKEVAVVRAFNSFSSAISASELRAHASANPEVSGW